MIAINNFAIKSTTAARLLICIFYFFKQKKLNKTKPNVFAHTYRPFQGKPKKNRKKIKSNNKALKEKSQVKYQNNQLRKQREIHKNSNK